MSVGSPDYWMTTSHFMGALLQAIVDSLSANGSVITVLDSLDGKFDNVITLDQLNGEQLTTLAAMFNIDVSLLSEGDIPTAIDMLDNVLDGKLDLSQISNALVSRQLIDSITQLTAMVAKQDSTLTQLTTVIDSLSAQLTELSGVHDDTTNLLAYGEEDWSSGGVGGGANVVLVSDVNIYRNLLKITNTGSVVITYARTNDGADDGQIQPAGSVTFHSSDGVWAGVGSGSYDAHEEWRT